jgi:hypothetical protein
VDTLPFDEGNIDSMSDLAVIGLARQVGVLLEEEIPFPALVRVRLKRNTYET